MTKDLLGHLDSEVLLGLLEMMQFQEPTGFKDHQGYQGTQEDPALKVTQVNQEESPMQVAPQLTPSRDHSGLLVLPVLQVFQDYQVPLALLVGLANLVLKVTEGIGGSREKTE